MSEGREELDHLLTKSRNRFAFESLLKRSAEGAMPKPCVYLSGIGGIGVSGVAHLLLDMGWHVCGVDVVESRETLDLCKRGAKIYLGHAAENLHHETVDVAVYSSAVRREKPDIVEVLRLGIPLVHRAEALASIMTRYRGICVAGMHGKTTVTGLLSSAMRNMGVDVGYAIGGVNSQFRPHARLCKKSSGWFVSETDESDGSLLDYFPEYGFILNIDRDHLDYYQTDEKINAVFRQFVAQVHQKVVCCADNRWVMELRKHGFEDKSITYGFSPMSDYQIVQREVSQQTGAQTFEVKRGGRCWGRFQIRLMGEHNVRNAGAVIALLGELGYSADVIAQSIGDFKGTSRRQELLFEDGCYRIIDDYGHHPSEIVATIQAVKQQGGRLLVVFQPHRFSRTKLLLNEFSTCFQGVDYLFLTDVYAASESPIPGISGECIADAVRAHGQSVEYLSKLADVGDAVAKVSRPGDVILFLGAGDITDRKSVV